MKVEKRIFSIKRVVPARTWHKLVRRWRTCAEMSINMEKHVKVPLSKEDAMSLRAGDYVYLTGIIYTARDAAHKKMQETLESRRSTYR